MEVHHHPDLHRKKKNFKEYFLEFLMIFLAVTIGLFAENIREHLDDRYANKVRSLMMMFNILIHVEQTQFERAKNLIALLNKEYNLKNR